MHHYFEAITNNKGDALTGYYVRLVDSGGAGVTLYADTSLTPIISVSGVADAAKVDSDGNVSFYVSVGTYTLNIYATDSTTLVRSIRDVGMNIDMDTAATAVAAQTSATASAAAAATSEANAATSATSASTSASSASTSASNAATSATSAAGSATTAAAAASSVSSVPNATAHAATRAALALLGSSAGPAYLDESGREGMFVWSSSNLSTLVAADTAQGVYVAPASDTTGASGAWVRKFSGPRALSTWWGLATTNTALQNGVAMNACMATLQALRLPNGYGYAYGCIGVHTPAGWYNIDRTITPECGLEVTGDATKAGSGTVFIWNADVGGIKISGWDGTSRHGSGTIIRGLTLKGNSPNTNGTSHGIEVNGACSVRDCLIDSFSGDGIYAWGSTGTNQGNANACTFQDIFIQNCRNGTHTDNSDGNAMTFLNVSCTSNRLSGHYDSSFLGCYYAYGTIQTNGLNTNYPTRCSYSGNVYTVVPGQETWCSTNAPSGTTANNTGWQYYAAGAPSSICPAWVTAMTWSFSAPFWNDDLNASTTFHSIYVESDGNPMWCTGSALVLGGFLSRPIYNTQSQATHGGVIKGTNTTVRVLRNIQTDNNTTAYGLNHYFGPQSGNPLGNSGDSDFQLHNTNVNSQLSFYQSGVLKSYILGNNSSFYLNSAAYNFRSASSVAWATLDSTGLKLNVGTIGYATGAGGAVTQATSRTTGVTLNKGCGQITLVSAAGSASWQTFTVTNSLVAATDVIRLNQASGTDLYMLHVTNVAAGSFKISFATTGGTTTEQPVLNFAVIKSVNA